VKWLRYSDLVKMGLFRSRMTLKRAIEEQGLSPGRLLMPNVRAWTEDEIQAWLDARPTAPKHTTRKAAPPPDAPIAA
jgi:hypothetical protein